MIWLHVFPCEVGGAASLKCDLNRCAIHARATSLDHVDIAAAGVNGISQCSRYLRRAHGVTAAACPHKEPTARQMRLLRLDLVVCRTRGGTLDQRFGLFGVLAAIAQAIDVDYRRHRAAETARRLFQRDAARGCLAGTNAEV
jgi:hypothetical protein